MLRGSLCNVHVACEVVWTRLLCTDIIPLVIGMKLPKPSKAITVPVYPYTTSVGPKTQPLSIQGPGSQQEPQRTRP